MKRIGLMIVGLMVIASSASAQVFYCPNDVDSKIPVALVDATDGETPETEKKFGDTTITVTDITDGNTPAAYTDDATSWTEIGDGTGDYILTIGASEFDEPDSVYFVKIVVAGCRTVRLRVMTPETVENRFNDILSSTGDGSAIALDASGHVYVSDGTGTGQINTASGVVEAKLVAADDNVIVDANTADFLPAASLANFQEMFHEDQFDDVNKAPVVTVGYFTDNGLDYFSSSGTLVSAIWGAVARTLTAPTNITSDDSKILASSGALTVGTNNDKTGYALSVAGLASVTGGILADPNYPMYTDSDGYVGVGTMSTDVLTADAIADSAATEIGAAVDPNDIADGVITGLDGGSVLTDILKWIQIYAP